eukprot:gnl/Dysnectes_brevis/4802_a6631_477.p1 GENE.gnl/Dysnectes_brevis/4802_a6631_477~~gnl/Dysnectes_brevis/4802_a6631_477.p1  ORF type:complete len:325 (+),score=28.96 gnl/Dysnectes_brevis/4802_a6631_477:2-976(+)
MASRVPEAIVETASTFDSDQLKKLKKHDKLKLSFLICKFYTSLAIIPSSIASLTDRGLLDLAEHHQTVLIDSERSSGVGDYEEYEPIIDTVDRFIRKPDFKKITITASYQFDLDDPDIDEIPAVRPSFQPSHTYQYSHRHQTRAQDPEPQTHVESQADPDSTLEDAIDGDIGFISKTDKHDDLRRRAKKKAQERSHQFSQAIFSASEAQMGYTIDYNTTNIPRHQCRPRIKWLHDASNTHQSTHECSFTDASTLKEQPIPSEDPPRSAPTEGEADPDLPHYPSGTSQTLEREYVEPDLIGPAISDLPAMDLDPSGYGRGVLFDN